MSTTVGEASAKTDIELCDFFDELSENSTGPITVMICRKWDCYNINGKYMSTDFIVSDKKGNVIHATAKSSIAHYFVERLQEGGLYLLRDFTVRRNRDEYRIIKDGKHLIEFNGSTVVKKAMGDHDGFVRYPFQIVSFNNLTPTANKYFIDVIGYVLSVGTPTKRSNNKMTVDFNLINERSQQVRVTLWESLGHSFIKRKEKSSEVYVVILTSMGCKPYNGPLCLSSSSYTVIIDDPNVPALKEFRESIRGRNLNVEGLSDLDTQRRTGSLQELLKWARVDKTHGALFRGNVEVVNVRTKNGWFNLTCTHAKCRKGVTQNEGEFWCSECRKPIPFPLTRFRIEIDVKDESGSAVVVFFDEVAEKLVGRTAKSLVEEQDQMTSVIEQLFRKSCKGWLEAPC